MNIQNLSPWNWFKHETSHTTPAAQSAISKSIDKDDHKQSEHPVMRLQQDIQKLFEQAFSGSGFSSSILPVHDWPLFRPASQAFNPSLNVSCDDANYHISMEVPGLKEEDMSIEVKDNVLTINGQKQQESEDKGRQFYRIERHYGAFMRTLDLPDDAKGEEIEANLKHGILELSIPRKEVDHSQVSKVEIH